MKPDDTKSPESAPVAPRAPSQIYDGVFDPLLDGLPKPEVVESNTETAWGRWEDLGAANEGPATVPQEYEPPPPNFEDTQPMSEEDLLALKRELGVR